jgi:glycosyltransferase involved in cell wall biosynthesis
MLERTGDVELSAIVPVGKRQADAAALYREYKTSLDASGRRYELIYVLDGPREKYAAGLRELLAQGEQFAVIGLAREFGEATALMAGFGRAAGRIIITLPAYYQIEPSEIATLCRATAEADLVVARRSPRVGGLFERMRRGSFHELLRWVTRLDFHDLGCSARAFDRRVLEEIHLYGDQHRFLPLLADRFGFKVREVVVKQSPRDRFAGRYPLRDYLRGLLDIITIFFLVRFTKKPLRFFGVLGALIGAIGALAVTWVVVERLVFHQPLAERPALLLASLATVLGLQLFALGLLGELIIFTHGRATKDYQIESVIQFGQGRKQNGD